ncbi:MAG: hypothetical protein ACRD4E_02570, partial [Bryobacteraceae bacterium]
MNRILKLALVTVAGGAIVGGLVWSFLAHRAEIASEQQSDQAIKNPARVTKGPGGETVVKFDRETQRRMDIRTEPVVAMTRRPEVAAYGHLEEDPSGSFVLRAPMAGTIQGAQQAWPNIGQTVVDRSIVGLIEPRLAPADRITFADRLATSKAETQSGKATLATALAALDRARTLNADDKNVSDRVVQEAEARVAAERARVDAATQSVTLIESSLAPAHDAAQPLELERGGQVVEVLVHP